MLTAIVAPDSDWQLSSRLVTARHPSLATAEHHEYSRLHVFHTLAQSVTLNLNLGTNHEQQPCLALRSPSSEMRAACNIQLTHSLVKSSWMDETTKTDVLASHDEPARLSDSVNDATATSQPAAPTSSKSRAVHSPPYWTHHDRTISNVSYQSIGSDRPAPITLEDHSEEHDVQTQGCWAKSVTIEDYIIISGPTGIGAYVVWNCTVETLKGGAMSIRKRYSEFDNLRINLIDAFPHAEASIPQLPRKSVVSRFRAKFLEHRKNGLNHFMNCILLNPEFAASPILKEFIFS